jgi:hypothetical protein
MSGTLQRKPIDPALVRQRLDCVDGALVWKPTGNKGWDTRFAGKKVEGKPNGCGYLLVGLNNTLYLYHRVFWVWHNGVIPENHSIDHINGNPLDNRIKNLRVVNTRQNTFNRTANKIKMHGFVKNISKFQGKWTVCIVNNGEKYSLGYYDNYQTATEIAVLGRLALHGEYARITEYTPEELASLQEKYKGVDLFSFKARSNSKSGVRGVTYDQSRNKWTANVKANGQEFRKRFATMEKAQEAVEHYRQLFACKEGIAA